MKGRCLCGAVEIAVEGAQEHEIGACHCRMCQRWSGGVFVCFRAEAEAVHVRGDVARHASSDFAERAFCPICGSHLWMRDTDRDGAPYDLMPGLFEAARDWPLRSEIYSDRAMASVRLEGAHSRISRTAFEAENEHVEGDMT
ncbi:GFA family protein [Roseovarius sp. SCSIO 43702]|uniref:GFA family protein n=1 Tax=Roseovarius sp. SCSIO 43702 TaxID=2823043 RepID=UPI001C7304D3|nr:GFA family protein [Roseovarius sp. SCSIO 43702]QYX57212.1 GFA family protein [Roseovarius sp. SCSIO 43702]